MTTLRDPNDLTYFRGPCPKPTVKGGTGRKKPHANRRTAASPARIREIRAKKCGECRLCETTTGVNAHHLIPRSQLGVWTEANVVGLCGSGTTGCHGLIEARNPAASYLLRALLTDSEYSYVCEKMGEGWVDRRYPVRWERP